MSAFAPAVSVGVVARDLGPRGSRAPVGDPDSAGLLSARSLAVLAAVPAWWRARALSAGLDGDWLDVEHALDLAMPASLGRVLADRSVTVDTLPDEIGAAYAASLDPGTRSRHGRHYTPPKLAEHLWEMTRRALGHGKPYRPLRGLVRDPACGAGVLLLPAIREHLGATVGTNARLALAGLPNVIEGIDADPAAVWIANVVLGAEALPILARVPARHRRPIPTLVSVGDGLATGRRPARAVVMNPPYGRVKLSSAERDRYADVLYGHANLYTLFMASGLDDLDADGVMAALVPTSFTAGRYFSKLREHLSHDAPLRDVAFVARRDGVFAGVLQETCLAVFTKTKAKRTSIATLNGDTVPVAKVRSPRTGRPWLLPRSSDDAHVAAAAATMPLTLGGAGWRASTGPLVWNRRRDDLFEKPGTDRTPVVWAADIDGGSLHQDRARDQLRFLALHGPADRKTFVLEEPAILVQRTTAPEQARRIVSAKLTSEDLAAWGGSIVVENHVNVLRPIGPAASALSSDALALLLSAPVIDQVMRCLAGSVALSAYELEALPLPDASTLRRWSLLDPDALADEIRTTYCPVIA